MCELHPWCKRKRERGFSIVAGRNVVSLSRLNLEDRLKDSRLEAGADALGI